MKPSGTMPLTMEPDGGWGVNVSALSHDGPSKEVVKAVRDEMRSIAFS